MWKRISSLVRFTKKVDSAQNTREKTEENLERDLVNSKKERSSEKFKTPRNCKENSGDEIFRILSHMSKQRKEVVDRRIYTRIFQFPLRINVKISEHAQNFNVFKPRLVCRRILILPSGSSGNSQKSEILKNLKFSKI